MMDCEHMLGQIRIVLVKALQRLEMECPLTWEIADTHYAIELIDRYTKELQDEKKAPGGLGQGQTLDGSSNNY